MDEGDVRAEIRGWLAKNWTDGCDERAFVDRVVDAGLACPTLPVGLFGRGMSADKAKQVIEEFERAGAPMGEGYYFANYLAINVIAQHASTEHLRRDVLRRLLTGEDLTCVLYSEPGAGSDVAAIQTRAQRSHDGWTIDGQKVWTSLAQEADHGILLARTNWDVPKHRGITMFLIPMKQPAVDVRPIKQMTGKSTFNEVFFTDAKVSDDCRVGDIDDGWAVLQTALAVERMVMGTGITHGRPGAPEMEKTPISLLISLAAQSGQSRDRAVRQAIARLHTLERIGQWNAERAAGAADAKAASIVKLAKSELLHGAARVHAMLLGMDAALSDRTRGGGHHANLAAMDAFQNSIAGGSDQIQRNLIGERHLGLPREPATDRDIPFSQVPKAEAVRPLG